MSPGTQTRQNVLMAINGTEASQSAAPATDVRTDAMRILRHADFTVTMEMNGPVEADVSCLAAAGDLVLIGRERGLIAVRLDIR